MSRLLHYDDRPSLQSVHRFRQDRSQAVDQVSSPRIVQSEQDDAHLLSSTERRNLTKVKVKGYDDTPLSDGLREDLAVRHPMEPLIAQVCRLMALVKKPQHDPHVYAHIGEKSHGSLL